MSHTQLRPGKWPCEGMDCSAVVMFARAVAANKRNVQLRSGYLRTGPRPREEEWAFTKEWRRDKAY